MRRIRLAGQLAEPISHYTDGVEAGGFLYVSGMLPLDANGDLVGAGDVVRQAEQPNAAVLATERLQPVEDRLAVVQHTSGGIQGERPVRHNAWIVPAFALMEVHQEHVVGEDLAEG